jgi:hypothetical protein
MLKGGQFSKVKKARGGVARSGGVAHGRIVGDLRVYLNDFHGLNVSLNVKVRVTVPNPPVPRKIRQIIEHASVAVDIQKELASLGIPLNGVQCIIDSSNQPWIVKLMSEYSTHFPGMQICVVASVSNMAKLPSNMVSTFSKVVVPDGDPSKDQVVGFYEDAAVMTQMKVDSPVVLGSGDCNTEPGKDQIYTGLCWRLQRGLQTIVIARKASCSDELEFLQGQFPKILTIMMTE